MWVLEIIDAVSRANLDSYGIRPRSADGLTGIVLAPLLHAGFGHLLANTVPFFVLGVLVAAEGHRRFWRTTAVVVALGGLGTWLLGDPSTVVIGASSLVFGYLTYLLARAFWSRRPTYALIAVLVLVLYGGLLLGVLPGTPGVSWQGHLSGALAGVVAARLGHGRRPPG
ncbi:hypothetical protein BH20ACT5_BH20ACT5_12410 [soil metagenome]